LDFFYTLEAAQFQKMIISRQQADRALLEEIDDFLSGDIGSPQVDRKQAKRFVIFRKKSINRENIKSRIKKPGQKSQPHKTESKE
jgi:hypothetical protein